MKHEPQQTITKLKTGTLVRNHFNSSPAEYEALRQGYIARRRFAMVRQALLAATPAGATCLELGCGTGQLAAQLAGAAPRRQFIGVDVEPAMIRYAESTYSAPNLRFAISDGSSALLPHCDFMYSIDVLHHIADPGSCLTTAYRALSPAGQWLVLEPNVFNLAVFAAQERMRRAGLGEDHFRPWRMERLMRDAGFSLRAKSYAFTFPGHWTRLPALLQLLERVVERAPFLGGNVVYLLAKVARG